MPFKKLLKVFGLGVEETETEKARREEAEKQEEERKKKKGRGLHGRRQMSDKEFEELEKASK